MLDSLPPLPQPDYVPPEKYHVDILNTKDSEEAFSRIYEAEDKSSPILIDWLVIVSIALLLTFTLRTFLLGNFIVEGTSMYPTLETNDRVFVNKASYTFSDPNRGDIVVLHQPVDGVERDLIKRVVALPGEVIEIRSCRVRIDGQLILEPYLDDSSANTRECGEDVGPILIPDDHVFVMGDNRGGSRDSRTLGTTPIDELVGRAFVIFLPQSSWRWL